MKCKDTHCLENHCKKSATVARQPRDKRLPKRKETAWNKHVKVVYSSGKKKNKAYKFSQALKDAAKTYKKK